MIDFHCHILPNIDDGPTDIAESLAMARALFAAGFTEVYCTPHHMRGVYDTKPAQVREKVDQLQKLVDEAGLALKLHTGCEYYLDEFFTDCLDDPITLGDSNKILVELPFGSVAPYHLDLLAFAVKRGFVPVIAHPERCESIQEEVLSQEKSRVTRHQSRVTDNHASRSAHSSLLTTNDSRLTTHDSRLTSHYSLLTALKDMGCLFQGNLGSFVGEYGERVRRCAEGVKEQNTYDVFGSDAHNERIIGVSLKK